MKLSGTKEFLTGLALISVLGCGQASAQSLADTAIAEAAMGEVGSGPMQNAPSVPAPLAADTAATASAPTAAPAESPAPQTTPVAEIPGAPQPIAATPAPDASGQPMPAAPQDISVAPSQPLPDAQAVQSASPAVIAPEPSQAELAIVQNAGTLGNLGDAKSAASPAPVAQGTGSPDMGAKVTDILGEPAIVRPWPERYLVVKKDHAADDTDARLSAARMALGRGQNQAALELFNDLYRENPLDERIAMGRAVAFQRLGQVDEALSSYEAALGRNPKNVEALTNMMGLLREQDPDMAIERLSQLRDIYPANADVTAQLGTVYGIAGDYEKALRYLEMADNLKPGNANILYNRAIVYDRMGKTTQAADLYRQVVAMAGDGTLSASFPIETVKRRLAVIR